jgi:predicted transcriptional regulator
MKSVLISIKPEWVGKITSGKKTIEVRKTAPKEVPFKAYIYCSYGDMKTNYYLKGRGKVIGELSRMIDELLKEYEE